MGFFNFFGRREVEQTAPSAALMKGGTYRNRGVYVGSPDQALKISAFYSGVELRARTMSQMVWQFQRLNRANGNYVEDDYGANGRLNYLLQVRPNPLMSATDLQKEIELAIILRGNAYIYIDRDYDGMPRYLWLCSSGNYNESNATYDITYRGQFGVIAQNAVAWGDILHLRNTFTYDGIRGIPTLRYMSDILSLDANNIELQRSSAANGGKVKLLVQEDKTTQQGLLARANQKQMEKITEQLNEDIYSKDVVMLNNVAGVTPISMTMQDLQILENRRLVVEDIARFLSVPQTMLGVATNTSYKTPQADMQYFFMRCVQPNILALEDELNAKLLSPEDFGKRRIHVCDRNLLRLDPQGQADLNRKLLEIGAKTVNDIRKEYDMPSVDKGDIVYVSAQWAELGSEKLSQNQVDGRTSAADETNEKGGEQ